MKQLSILLAAAMVLSACGGSNLTADEVRGVLPTSDSATVGTPDGGGATYAVAPSGSPAEYKTLTAGLALTVNGGVALVLGIVKGVVESPATSCSGDTCTWGPGPGALGALDPNLYKLVVTKIVSPTLHYEWSLSAELRFLPSGFVEIISGVAYPSGQKLHGNGTFSIDFDQAQILGGSDAGKLDVTYDNVTNVTVSCQLHGGIDTTRGGLMNAAYSYDESAAGGDLQIAVDNAFVGYSLTLHSRWSPTGAGRGDASYADAYGTYTRSECWDSSAMGFQLVYESTSPASFDDVGVETDCAFAPASFATLPLP